MKRKKMRMEAKKSGTSTALVGAADFFSLCKYKREGGIYG
jgi:hypothetical protein